MHQLILIRHGESLWNQQGRFTGWTDIDLSPAGRIEMRNAADALAAAGLRVSFVVTSTLKRAVRSCWILQEALDLMWLPVRCEWRLNERHYGALTGHSKRDAQARFGAARVRDWRRGFQERPPPMAETDPRAPGRDRRYAAVDPGLLPRGESLADTQARVVALWQDTIVPALAQGENVLMIGHGNSLRVLMKHLEGLSDDAIVDLDVPNGVPFVYQLDAAFKPLRREVMAVAHETHGNIL